MFRQFSTRAVAPDRRLDYWNEVVGGVFDGMTVDADRTINAVWSHAVLGPVVVGTARSQKALVDRWGVAGRPGSARERLLVHLQHEGHSMTQQAGRSAMIGRGELTTCLSDEPYKIHISDQNLCLVVDCPLERLVDRVPGLEERLVSRIPSHAAPVRLLREFLVSLARQTWPEAPSDEDSAALGEVVLTLVERALAAEPAEAFAPSGTRERVLAYVREHLFDPDLRTGAIADALGVSRRTVQDVFAGMATTPTAFITEQRLAAAARKLAGGADCGRITDLALDLGFNDPAYFARVFRARYQVSPNAYREGLR
jgi:AraC-like DNA-binding protein